MEPVLTPTDSLSHVDVHTTNPLNETRGNERGSSGEVGVGDLGTLLKTALSFRSKGHS